MYLNAFSSYSFLNHTQKLSGGVLQKIEQEGQLLLLLTGNLLSQSLGLQAIAPSRDSRAFLLRNEYFLYVHPQAAADLYIVLYCLDLQNLEIHVWKELRRRWDENDDVLPLTTHVCLLYIFPLRQFQY